MALLTVTEKVRVKPSRRQHKVYERDWKMVVQQLESSIPQSILMKTSYRGEEQEIVVFEDHDQKGEEVEQNLEQESLSGEKKDCHF